MGKKGKKGKVTGTIEVVKLKTISPGKEQYAAMLAIGGCKAQNLAGEYEVLPEVRRDVLTEADNKKLNRFFAMMGGIASFCKLEEPRPFRFRLHHMYLYPVPNYTPCGYTTSVVTKSRQVIDYPQLKLNGVGFKWDRWSDHPYATLKALLSESDKIKPAEFEGRLTKFSLIRLAEEKKVTFRDPETGQDRWKSLDLIEKCNDFLDVVDKANLQIPSYIEEHMPDFAGTTLKKFKSGLLEKLAKFENAWTAHEELIMKVWHDIHEDVFAPVVDICYYEHELSLSEEENNFKAKQPLEIKLVDAIEKFYNLVYPAKKGATPMPWHEQVGPLSEGCVFYETKSSAESLNMCRHVIKAMVDLRRYIKKIPTARLYEQYDKNEEFCRLLKQFKAAVDDADGALTATEQLPPIINFKNEGWMTFGALDEEVHAINDGACKIRELNLPEPEPAEEELEAKKASADVETSMMIRMTPEVDQIAAKERLALMLEQKGW